MEWDADPAWAEVFDDQGPWVHHVATAWRAAATASPMILPRRPVADRDGNTDHAETIAFWTAPFHLLAFGLGWTRIDLGLERWQQTGFEPADPILSVVQRWLGKDYLEQLVAHAATSPALARIGLGAHGLNFASLPESGTIQDSSAMRRLRETSRNGFDGNLGDSLHIFDHIGPSWAQPAPPEQAALTESHPTSPADPTPPRITLLLDRYVGWYRTLCKVKDTKGVNGRRVRADVIVRPVGWLGEYRRHDETGLWFRGRASTHLWGQ